MTDEPTPRERELIRVIQGVEFMLRHEDDIPFEGPVRYVLEQMLLLGIKPRAR